MIRLYIIMFVYLCNNRDNRFRRQSLMVQMDTFSFDRIIWVYIVERMPAFLHLQLLIITRSNSNSSGDTNIK
ncbi:hypothetical protein BLOT_009956 [Blomia tropicalis]|nr:hypothetical protein BLOT_009956 [Blomia tropicalis]